MAIDWGNIRPLNNTKNDGFEELVCQLAAKQKITGQKNFHRIGKPDGGKECVWECEDGSLYQWQAKYFLSSPGSGQWAQIHDSVISAIDNHPKLVRYTIALPIDRPDSKVKGQISMLAKWNTKKEEWGNYAKAKGMQLEFDYWGNHELVLLLARLENEGLKYFWFNNDEFSDHWFDVRNQESKNALGSRYTSNLNVEVSISKYFDGLSRNKSFEKDFQKLYNKLLEKFRGIRFTPDEEMKSLMEELSGNMMSFRKLFESLNLTGNEKLPLHGLAELCEHQIAIVRKIELIFYGKRQEKTDAKIPQPHYSSRPFSTELNALSNLTESIHSFNEFLGDYSCRLANHPFVILTGKAGMGKSHLLADLLTHRKEIGHQSLLLLGENFSTNELPWTQILYNHIRKPQIDELTFMGALNAKAESLQSRIVIFIDAINEGEGTKIWPRNLKSFFQSFESYPWLGLVVSIRSSYEKLIAPFESIDDAIAHRLRHYGFEGIEYEASKLFFEHYKIIQPASPFLDPEFQNPLFLKLYCKALFDRGQHVVPPGYEGITKVIDYFLESVNYKLAQADQLYYEEHKHLVQNSVKKIITQIVDNGNDYLDYSTSDAIVDSVFRNNCINPEPFLRRLISEEVFNVDLTWHEDGSHSQVIFFAYQRFQDHLTVSLLLDNYLDVNDPEKSFKTGKLYEVLVSDTEAWYNQHLIEAFSIQLPERINKELYEVAPFAKQYQAVAEAFIDSLIWRKIETIGPAANDYVNDFIIHDEELFNKFLEEIISISVKPGHPFNAESLHQYLIKLDLSERDSVWTTWLQDKYGDESSPNSVRRIIDWAWNEDDKTHITDEAVRLGTITLSWCLTSANRYLRDAATKALVCLLQDRTGVLTDVLNLFKEVNDPYVLERLYAVAYGCTLRKIILDNSDAMLAKYIYDEIFNKDQIIPNILLRDYARGVIEYVLHRGVQIEIEVEKIRPPYISAPLPKKFPTIKTIDRKFKPKREDGNYGKINWGITAILSSMTTEYGRGTAQYGDFGRYVFQRALGDWNVNSDGLSNYAVQRIFELGYDTELFGEFDGRQGSGRGSGHKERIGKKYQWIIFYELLARVADHYQLIDESDWETKSYIPYEGPWYPYVRDIDPTIVLRQTKRERYSGYTLDWKFNAAYAPIGETDKIWIAKTDDLPDLRSIIQVQDPLQNKWLWLELQPEWSEKEKLGEDRHSTNRKRLWYQIRSYLIKEEDVDKLKSGILNKNKIERMPEARSLHYIFSREYYWSASFSFFNKRYYSGEKWSEIYHSKNDSIVSKVMKTTEYFNWEEDFDCSKIGTLSFYKPTEILKTSLNLDFSIKEGVLCDSQGEDVCMDPSVNEKCISGLLIHQDKLSAFLHKEKLKIVWWIVGEKQILGSNYKRNEYPGRLMINGFYQLEDGNIVGEIKTNKYNG